MSVDVVTQVKQELLAAGENLDGPCGAFKITATVGWRLRADGWGLIASTGNGCPDGPHGNCRADTLMQKDGSVIDCLIQAQDNEGLVYPAVPHDSYNIPAWNPTGPQPPENWREPYDPGFLADTGGESGGGDDGAAEALQLVLDAIAASEARLVEQIKADGDATRQKLDYYADQLEHAASVILAVVVAHRRREGDSAEPKDDPGLLMLKVLAGGGLRPGSDVEQLAQEPVP